MLIKKRRPFWSFDLEATEKWLQNLAKDGYELIDIKKWSKTFLFQKTSKKTLHYQIVYDKKRQSPSKTLQDAGWRQTIKKGNWFILNNSNQEVTLFPTRDGAFKRKKFLTNLLSAVSLFYSFQLLIFLLSFGILFIFGDGMASIETSPLWVITIVYFLQVIVVISLTFYAQAKIKTLQLKHFNSQIDSGPVSGETFSKWKFAWADNPRKLENWLTKMAENGFLLNQISSKTGRFIFEKTRPKKMAYVLDFQWKASAVYFDAHKSAGWLLKYTSPYSWFKFSLWSQEYQENEAKPEFIYSPDEEKQRLKKLHLGSMTSAAFPLLLIIYFLAITPTTFNFAEATSLNQVLTILIAVLAVIPISRILRIIFAYKNS